MWGLRAERDLTLHDRVTIDLIAPASLAGGGRRAAQAGRTRLLSIREPLVDLAQSRFQHVLPSAVVGEAMNDWLDAFDKP